jgi:glycosyltransferase involved in cell wall biosynthesis
MMKKQRIAIIGTVGLPAKYGGFETLANHLVERLANRHDITVYCSSKSYNEDERVEEFKGAKLTYLPLKANGIQSIIYDSISILHALLFSDTLLVLGVAGAWLLPFVRLFTKKKVIISIDGIEWKRAKWNLLARLYLRWAEKIAVRYAHIDISDNESIQNYTAARYGTLSRVIEYGADHTMQVDVTSDDQAKYPFMREDYAFKVCRIEPENNIEMVLESFASCDLPLVLVGNWNASEYGKRVRAAYQNHNHLFLLDPIYDQRSIDLLRSNALLYVHGHSAGGTNPSLVEAMYLGLPILAFGVSYNRTTTEHNALYFKTAGELKELIHSRTNRLLTSLGERMKNIADNRYTWEIVANKYDALFREVATTKKKSGIAAKTVEVKSGDLQRVNALHLTNTKLLFEN